MVSKLKVTTQFTLTVNEVKKQNQIVIDTFSYYTIYKVKQLCCEKDTSLNINTIELRFNNKSLINNRSLESYGIVEDEEVLLYVV